MPRPFFIIMLVLQLMLEYYNKSCSKGLLLLFMVIKKQEIDFHANFNDILLKFYASSISLFLFNNNNNNNNNNNKVSVWNTLKLSEVK